MVRFWSAFGQLSGKFWLIRFYYPKKKEVPMAHCNDQLIEQLLTQAEQEGRCLIPPSTAIRKALL